MVKRLDELFGELRSLFASRAKAPDFGAQLLELLDAAQTLSPERYHHNWLPYIKGQRGAIKVDEPIARAKSLDALERWGLLLPDALFELDLSKDELPDLSAFIANPALDRVAHLDLSSSGLDIRSLAELLRSVTLSSLRRLSVAHNRLWDGSVTDSQDARKLARGYGLSSVPGFVDRDTLDLAFSPNVKNLTYLNLSNTGFDSVGAAAMANSAYLSKLETLRVSRSNLRGVGLELIAKSANLVSLKHLDVSNCELDDRDVAVLAGSTQLANLRKLDLTANRLGATGVQFIGSSPNFANLRTLILDRNVLAVSGARALGGADALGELQHVSLRETQLRDDGVLALVSEEGWSSSLRYLDLSSNSISAAGVEALLSRADLIAGLETIVLGDNPIPEEDLDELFAAVAGLQPSESQPSE